MRHLATSALLLLCGVVASLPAQDSLHSSKVSVPDDLVAEPLERARRALEVGDLDRAIAAYQRILDRLPTKVQTVHRSARRGDETDRVLPGDRFAGIWGHVLGLIRDLPENGLTRYRELMEPRARPMLERALSTGNDRLLREVTRRYPLSPSGQRAAFTMIDQLLEAGRFDEARVCAQSLRRCLFDASEAEERALVTARVGLALWGAGRQAELESLARQISSDGEIDLPITVAGKATPLSSFIGDLRGGEPEASLPAPAHPLSIFRKLGEPLTRVNRNPETGSEHYFAWGSYETLRSAHYPVIPQVRDGIVYYCDGLTLAAKSLFTGKDVWSSVTAPSRRFEGKRNRNLYFHVELDRDIVLGYLEGAPFSQAQQLMRGYQPIESIATRKLVAVEASTGDVLWSHLHFSDDDPADTEFIRKSTVNSRPLVVGDTIYVAATFYLGGFRQWLCAFERDTGRLKWRTYLGQGQMELNMFGNPVKEATPGPVFEHDGCLYYSTNVGTVAAVEAATGTVRWISAYEQMPIPRTRDPITHERYPGWFPSRAAASKRRLFIAPSDCQDLLAIDIDTGSWRPVLPARRTARSRNLYFLGIHGDQLLVAGRTLVAIDPDSLRERWETAELSSQRRRDSSTIQGLPAVDGGRITFTYQDAEGRTEIYQVDLANGRFVERKNLRSGGRTGNVVVATDAVVVAGEDRIYSYFDLVAVERRLKRDVAGRPRDPDLLLRLGDVRLERRDWGQAISSFERALEIAESLGIAGRPGRRRARLALYNAWLNLARDPEVGLARGPADPAVRFDRAVAYADTDHQRVEALRDCLLWSYRSGSLKAFRTTARTLIETYPLIPMTMSELFQELVPDIPGKERVPAGLLAALIAGANLERSGKAAESVGFYQEALERFPDFPVGAVSAWQYAGERIRVIIDAVGKQVYRKQELAAVELLKDARRGGDIDTLRALLRRYPQSSVVEEAYLELSRAQLEAGAFRSALQDMQLYLARFGRVSPEVVAEYARCLHRLGAEDSALQALERLRLQFPHAMMVIDGGRFQADRWAQKILQEKPLATLQEPQTAPRIPTGLSLAWERGAGDDTSDDARILVPRGREPASHRLGVLIHQGSELASIDVETGTLRWSKACTTSPQEIACWSDDRLMIALDGDVCTLDPKDGTEQWRLRMERREILDVAAGHGKVYVLSRDLLATTGLVLSAHNLLSGDRIQETFLYGIRWGGLAVGSSYLLVSSDREGRGYCLDGLTGAIMGGRSFAFDRYVFSPILTRGGLVVLPISAKRSDRLRLVGRDPRLGTDKWSHELPTRDVQAQIADPDNLALRMRTRSSHQRGADRRVTVFNPEDGRTRFHCQLQAHEFVTDATISDGRVFLTVMANPPGQEPVRLIRVCRLATEEVLWETPYFSGRRLDLAIQPTHDYLLLRKTGPRGDARSSVSDGSLFFMDLLTGKAVDRIELGKATYATDDRGLLAKDGVLVLTLGEAVRGLRK